MKFIAAIAADLETSPLGTRSRLRDELAGRPVLRCTVERVLAARRITAVHVLAPTGQASEISALLGGLPVQVETHVGTQTPYAGLVRIGRWWGLDGWRGGIGGLCSFDEDIHIALLSALTERTGADAVLSIPAAAPLVDPAVIDAMIGHYETYEGTVRLTLAQAPPGLAGLVIGRTLLAELLPTNQPPGVLLTYHPDHPLPDATGKEVCYRPAAEVIEARGRLVCDTRRSFERVRDLIEAGGERWDAAKIGTWLSARARSYVAPVPEEIEIELTTEDPLAAGSLMHPRGAEVGQRGPIELPAIRDLVAGVADYDDVRIVLGGFGDPCCHPQFGEICRLLRDSGIAAIAVRTGAAFENEAAEDALFETPVDAIEVTLDAATPETYRRIHESDAFPAILARLERWVTRRAARQQARPLIVPSMVKAEETFQDLEAFYNTWQRRLGAALITGYTHRAGQRPRRAVTSTTPPKREPCRRVFARMVVLADGSVTTCDQDFTARQTIGRLGGCSLVDLWRGDSLSAIRGKPVVDLPLCPACEEWHRP